MIHNKKSLKVCFNTKRNIEHIKMIFLKNQKIHNSTNNNKNTFNKQKASTLNYEASNDRAFSNLSSGRQKRAENRPQQRTRQPSDSSKAFRTPRH